MFGYQRVVVTGSLAYDHIMSMPGRFADHIMPDKIHMLNVSFIMKSFRREFGGTGGNIAYSLSLLGIETVLVGSAGKDFEPYRKHLSRLESLDCLGIVEYGDVATAQGFVMTDQDDNQIWGFFEGAMARETKLSLRGKLTKGDLLVVAPNNPKAMVSFVKQAIKEKIDFVFDPAFNIAHFSKVDLARGVKKSALLVGNDYEMALISEKLGWSKEKLLKEANVVVTTLSSKGSLIEQGREKIRIKAARVKDASDPTGAGDAFRAGFIAGLVRGVSLETAGQIGSVAAAYTVEKYGTQTHKYSRAEFEARYKDNFGTEIGW